MKTSFHIAKFISKFFLLFIVSSTAPGASAQTGIDSPTDFLNRYAVTDYDAREPADVIQKALRSLKNARHDKEDWVSSKHHPDTSGVGRDDEVVPELLIPAEESNLIFIGEIKKVEAFLSND